MSEDILEIHHMIQTAANGDDDQVLNILEKITQKLADQEAEIAALRRVSPKGPAATGSEMAKGMPVCPAKRELKMGYSHIKAGNDKPISIEQVESLYHFLQGQEIDGIHCENMPHLSESQAFSVIYFLQEQLEVLPDRFEACMECKVLVDTEVDGYYREDVGTYCDDCSVGVD